MSRKIDKSNNLVLLVASSIMVFAPLIYGGKSALALLVMESLGILLLFLLFAGRKCRQRVSSPVLWFLICGLLLMLLYLIPLPVDVWRTLPGRELYASLAGWLESDTKLSVYKSLSLVPLQTASTLLFAVPVLAMFLVTVSLPVNKVFSLVCVFLFTACVQSILGILQYFVLDDSLHFGIQSSGVHGTYLNGNHLTLFMEMAEPLALALMIYMLVTLEWSKWLRYGCVILFVFISLMLTFVPLVTASRMGAALLLLSIFLSFWVLATPGIRKQVMVPIIALRFVLLGIAILLQLGLLKRMTGEVTSITQGMGLQSVTGDLRWSLWRSGWEGIVAFAPFGSGPGTFQSAYQAYQPVEVVQSVSHLHNDYLQLLFEMGLPGLFLILYFLILYVWQWFQVSVISAQFSRLLQAAAGVSILLFLLYSITDFNLHTPTNVVFFAFLAGLFFRVKEFPCKNEV